MKNLLVLDKVEYQTREKEFLDMMEQYVGGENQIIYTSYEDGTIRKVRNFRYVGAALQHILYWKKSWHYAKEIAQKHYDNIYCVNPIVGLFLGLLNQQCNRKIILGGFLFEPKDNKVYYSLRKNFARKSLKGIETAVVYGSHEVEYYKNIFGDVTNFKFLKYGIDFDESMNYTKQPLPDRYYFSGGGSNRDYETLIKAYNNDSVKQLPLVIATQPWHLDGMDTGDITVLSDVVVEDFGDVLKRANALVLSLKDSDVSVGHMVMFQGMKLGVPIIVNDIPAIRDYVDESMVTFYKTKDCSGLGKILKSYTPELEKANAAKETYEKGLTFSAFLKRFILA